MSFLNASRLLSARPRQYMNLPAAVTIANPTNVPTTGIAFHSLIMRRSEFFFPFCVWIVILRQFAIICMHFEEKICTPLLLADHRLTKTQDMGIILNSAYARWQPLKFRLGNRFADQITFRQLEPFLPSTLTDSRMVRAFALEIVEKPPKRTDPVSQRIKGIAVAGGEATLALSPPIHCLSCRFRTKFAPAQMQSCNTRHPHRNWKPLL